MTTLPHRWRISAALGVPLALSLALAGCSGSSDGDGGAGGGGGGETQATGASFEPDGGTWTVLHYGVADNNLEAAMVGDLNEMGEIGSQGKLQLRAYLDRSADEYPADPGLDQGDWVGAKVLDVLPDDTSTLVADLGEVDSSDPQTLADFITQGFTDLPADHYALIISDHGGQWTGIAQDESAGGSLLDLGSLQAGIQAGLEGAGLDKLDVLGFDACLMAGYEVANAMAPLADRMIASQETEPGHGWDYASLQAAVDGASPDGLGKAIIDGFQGQSEEEGDVASVTLSMLDLTQMDQLDTAVEGFANAVASSGAAAPAVGRAQAEVPQYGREPDPEGSFNVSDLGQLAVTVGEDAPEVAEPASALADAVDSMVLYDFNGAVQAKSTGISIYLPPNESLYNTSYPDATPPSAWSGFLDSYFGFGRSIEESALPTFTVDAPEVEYDDAGVNLYATYDPAAQDNLTEATISYGLYEDDGTVTYYGEEAADLGTADDPTIAGSFDYSTLTMTDGEDTVDAYTQLEVDEDAGLVSVTVPLVYVDPSTEEETDVSLELLLDAETGDYVSDNYYTVDPDTGLSAEGDLDPDGLIYPEVPNYDADGNETWLYTTDVGLYADLENIDYEFVPLDSGTPLQMDLGLYDFGGNVAYSTTTDVVVP